MTLVLDATPGGSAANTFCTLAEANAFAEGRLNASTWTAATDGTKNTALVAATRLLCTAVEWSGYAVTETQALVWPRDGMYTRNGWYIDRTTIPVELKNATAEFAIQLLSTDPYAADPASAAGLTELQAGPVTLKFDKAAKAAALDAIFDAAWLLIPSHWGTRKGPNTGVLTLTRA